MNKALHKAGGFGRWGRRSAAAGVPAVFLEGVLGEPQNPAVRRKGLAVQREALNRVGYYSKTAFLSNTPHPSRLARARDRSGMIAGAQAGAIIGADSPVFCGVAAKNAPCFYKGAFGKKRRSWFWEGLKGIRAFWAAGFIAVTACCAFACDKDDPVNRFFCPSAAAPAFLSCKVVSATRIDFTFSTPVEVVEARLEPEMAITGWNGGETVSLLFENERCTGEQMVADMLVADENGNTLNLLVPFRTRNNRVPAFVINEIRTEHTGSGTKRAEFIEFKTLSAGNMGAVRVFIARAGIDKPVYEFPPVEVGADEYITLHLRTFDGDNPVDELGGPETFGLASPETKGEAPLDSRDLWVGGNKELLRKTDAVYVVDQDDRVLDAVMFFDPAKDKEWEKNKVLSQVAELLARHSAWLAKDGTLVKTPAEADAVPNTSATTKTLCRNEALPDTNTANDWYVPAKSSTHTPGRKNTPPSSAK